MHLLLCAATEVEIRPVMEWLGKENIPGVEVTITGVGLTAAVYSITKCVLTRRPDFILQAGIAGALDLELPLTKVVLVENEIIGDLGVEEKGAFRSLFDLQLLKKDEYPWIHGKLCNNLGPLKATGLKIVDGVTVNEISTSRHRIDHYRKNGAAIESMEGAALHYVALMERIPFLQVRSLSNFVGERDKSRWVMQPAINQLNTELQRILLNLFKR